MNDNPAQLNSELPQPQTHNKSKINNLKFQNFGEPQPGLEPGVFIPWEAGFEFVNFDLFKF